MERGFSHRVTRLLDIQHPVLLAPMDAIAGGDLAVAVTRAGGLGMIGGDYGNTEWLESKWVRARKDRTSCWSAFGQLQTCQQLNSGRPPSTGKHWPTRRRTNGQVTSLSPAARSGTWRDPWPRSVCQPEEE